MVYLEPLVSTGLPRFFLFDLNMFFLGGGTVIKRGVLPSIRPPKWESKRAGKENWWYGDKA